MLWILPPLAGPRLKRWRAGALRNDDNTHLVKLIPSIIVRFMRVGVLSWNLTFQIVFDIYSLHCFRRASAVIPGWLAMIRQAESRALKTLSGFVCGLIDQVSRIATKTLLKQFFISKI